MLNRAVDAAWDAHEWGQALAIGRQARLLPLWYITLQRAGVLSTLPPAVHQSLQQAYYAALAANTLALEETVHLSAQLMTNGIDVVALKGVALLATVYPSLGARPLGDIDLWVRSEDAAQAESMLRLAGYTDLPHQRVRGPQYFLAERAFMRHTPPRLQVDLHTAPFARPALHNPVLAAWLWSHTLTAPTTFGPLRVFDAAAQFVHLCLHATQHDEGRLALLRLHDLALVMDAPHIDWCAVSTIAQATHIAPALLRAVAATTVAWGAQPSPHPAWPPRTRWQDRFRCALLASDHSIIRWLVDGWALHNPVAMVALWCAVLWPAPAYRTWRAAIRVRERMPVGHYGGEP
ncbi:MAG TPA: nucleotidyltransferase family protein [Chloroflexi bacterium]|nr:nucleotidyltransferase family protein [Chloroflexota bacterium]